VRDLRDYIRNSKRYKYGLKWVVVREISPIRDKCLYIVVRFYYQGDDGTFEGPVGLLRSLLKKVLSVKEADRMIAEAIGFDPNVCLEDTCNGVLRNHAQSPQESCTDLSHCQRINIIQVSTRQRFLTATLISHVK
jgi:hypothetical protein